MSFFRVVFHFWRWSHPGLLIRESSSVCRLSLPELNFVTPGIFGRLPVISPGIYLLIFAEDQHGECVLFLVHVYVFVCDVYVHVYVFVCDVYVHVYVSVCDVYVHVHVSVCDVYVHVHVSVCDVYVL